MKFGAIPLAQAEGAILGHNVAGEDGRRLLRKGRVLSAEDVTLLYANGHKTVYAATLEPGDIDEDRAAARIAAVCAGDHVQLSGATTGRCNSYAAGLGIFRVDIERLAQLNMFEGVTLATLQHNSVVEAGRTIATLKILPYALPQHTVIRAEQSVGQPPLLRVDLLPVRRVSLMLSGSPSAQARITRSFEKALRTRLTNLNAALTTVDFVSLDDESGEAALAERIAKRVTQGADLVILAGETAIQDRHDIAPRAVVRAGGIVECYGAPVDPGNLMLLGYLGSIPVLGAPGCARSPKTNIVDMVLPRLLVGDRLTQMDIVALGHGGLLEDVSERPLPRNRVR